MSIRALGRLISQILFATLLGNVFCNVPSAYAQQILNVINHGGPTLQNPIRVFYIYWLPPGVVLDTSVADGVGNFTTLLKRFIDDLSGSNYANILTQYPGSCGPSQCVMSNGAGAFTFAGSWTDSQNYPSGRGTRANPLQDSDVQNEIVRAIEQNFWTADVNSIFFVFTGVFTSTGAPVEECQGGECTFTLFCAYHDHFSSGGSSIRYSYVSDASFNTGDCTSGIGGPGANGQVASDREVAVVSHELFEAVTDPEGNGWFDDVGFEIGDLCAQMGSFVTMNGSPYNIQQQWNNASANCDTLFGPSVKLTIATGSDDLRGDSTAAASLKDVFGHTLSTFSLKGQDDSGWDANTSHIVVGALGAQVSTALASVEVTFNSHFFDDWNIDAALIEVFDTMGNKLCSQTLNGSPLARLTSSSSTTTFDAPNCQPQHPQESVLCYVFNDGYTDMSDTTDAIFINSSHQACMPGGPTGTGICRKWAGRCITSPSGKTVTMNVFDDGGANSTGSVDAVFINGHNQACIPGGGASGTCRRWFGQGQTADGHDVMCIVFDDAYTNQSLLSGAVYVNGNQKSCIPDGTPQGTCAKWWGRCVVQ